MISLEHAPIIVLIFSVAFSSGFVAGVVLCVMRRGER